MGSIVVGRKVHYLGSYLTEEETAQAYDAAARYHYGEYAYTNFEGSEALSGEEVYARYKASLTAEDRATGKSKYLGVAFYAPRDCPPRWKATFTVNRKQTYIGVYKSEEEAAKARDAKVKELGLNYPLNFPD